jgi:hypothetical protein
MFEYSNTVTGDVPAAIVAVRDQPGVTPSGSWRIPRQLGGGYWGPPWAAGVAGHLCLRDRRHQGGRLCDGVVVLAPGMLPFVREAGDLAVLRRGLALLVS